MLGGEVGESLSVKRKSSLLQLRDERAVGRVAILAYGGVEPNYPELAERRLLVLPVGESVAAGTHERFVGGVQFLRANTAIAFGPLQNILAALIRQYSSFDACHT